MPMPVALVWEVQLLLRQKKRLQMLSAVLDLQVQRI